MTTPQWRRCTPYRTNGLNSEHMEDGFRAVLTLGFGGLNLELVLAPALPKGAWTWAVNLMGLEGLMRFLRDGIELDLATAVASCRAAAQAELIPARAAALAVIEMDGPPESELDAVGIERGGAT